MIDIDIHQQEPQNLIISYMGLYRKSPLLAPDQAAGELGAHIAKGEGLIEPAGLEIFVTAPEQVFRQLPHQAAAVPVPQELPIPAKLIGIFEQALLQGGFSLFEFESQHR